jgi:hypothetical protein
MEETLSRYEGNGARSANLPPEPRGSILTNVFFILFCLEIGLVLFLLPWTALWDNNYFFSLTPHWNYFWLSTYLRGAISGVGLVNIWIGVAEAWRMWR